MSLIGEWVMVIWLMVNGYLVNGYWLLVIGNLLISN
jgi:hypothetical protein